MSIPKKFNLFGQTYKVVYVPEIHHELEGQIEECFGLCQPDLGTITISSKCNKPEQVFCHELVHAMLAEMGHELYHDESFVSIMGNLIHQSLFHSLKRT